MAELCTCTPLTPLDTGPGAVGPPEWEQDPDCPVHFEWRYCAGLTRPCGAPTTYRGRHVVETRLGVGTVTIGRLCTACAADSHDLDDEARRAQMDDNPEEYYR